MRSSAVYVFLLAFILALASSEESQVNPDSLTHQSTGEEGAAISPNVAFASLVKKWASKKAKLAQLNDEIRSLSDASAEVADSASATDNSAARGILEAKMAKQVRKLAELESLLLASGVNLDQAGQELKTEQEIKNFTRMKKLETSAKLNEIKTRLKQVGLSAIERQRLKVEKAEAKLAGEQAVSDFIMSRQSELNAN